jgi:hypothetical protein
MSMKKYHISLLLMSLVVLVSLSGCIEYIQRSGRDQGGFDQGKNDKDQGENDVVNETFNLGLTYIREDGNRYLMGSGKIDEDRSMDIKIDGIPEWIVGIPYDNGSLWGIVLRSGELVGIHSTNGTMKTMELSPSHISAGRPVALGIVNGTPKPIVNIFENESQLTHPIILEDGAAAAVLNNGTIAIKKGNSKYHLSANALLDTRILINGSRIMVLSDPTEEYNHGIMGDTIEAGSITIINTDGVPYLETIIEVPDGKVIEGIIPIWTDMDNDGEREVIVTLSNSDQGAQIVAFNEQGEIKYQGPTIGQGYRWRHQLAVAPFDGGIEKKLVDILTPHIGGVVEFYDIKNGAMNIGSSLSGYSSHKIGSRNLDMAVSGDLDGDGILEILVPYQDHSGLAAIEKNEEGAFEDWSLDIPDRLSTNIMGFSDEEGKIHIAVGSEDGTIRIWS